MRMRLAHLLRVGSSQLENMDCGATHTVHGYALDRYLGSQRASDYWTSLNVLLARESAQRCDTTGLLVRCIFKESRQMEAIPLANVLGQLVRSPDGTCSDAANPASGM